MKFRYFTFTYDGSKTETFFNTKLSILGNSHSQTFSTQNHLVWAEAAENV